MKHIYLLFFLCLLCSCKESEKEKIARLVREWDGKEISFPSHSVFTIQGKDTVDFSFADAEYKIITYIDSVGCTSCKLQLPRWKEFMHEVDSLAQGKVPFVFYFHPKDVKELRYITRRDAFTYPVCFDEKDDFNALNRFPSEMTFQSFLLNRENKVIAIGNPVHNPKVKELYLQRLTNGKMPSSSVAMTDVSVNTGNMDFGTFPQSEKQEYKFVLTNEGNNLLVIQDVTTSCGCTKANYSKEPVRPGASLQLTVTYEAEEKGHFNKMITVYCNTKASPLRLMIAGNAK